MINKLQMFAERVRRIVRIVLLLVSFVPSPLLAQYTQVINVPNQQVNQSSSTDYVEEPSIAINPMNNSNIIIVAQRFYQPPGNPLPLPIHRPYYYVTTNAGTTWTESWHPTSNDQVIYDASISFDSRGYAYHSYLITWFSNLTNYFDVDVYRSTDGGASWPTSYVTGSASGSDDLDKPHVMCDADPNSPFKNNAYSAYVKHTGGKDDIYFSRLESGTGAFTSAIKISDSSAVQGPNIAVALGGAVYVAFVKATNGESDRIKRIKVDKSTDGGKNFGTDMLVSQAQEAGTYGVDWCLKSNCYIKFNTFPSLAIDKTNGAYAGNIYLVWGDGSNGDADIFFSRSTNAGGTWSLPPTRVNNDGLANGKDQWFPWMAVDPNGKIFITFYDSRGDVNNIMTDVYLATSTDGGQTFMNTKINTQSFDPRTRIGDYIGITATSTKVYPCWTDPRAIPSDIYLATFTPAIVDQKLQDGLTQVGLFGRWNGTSFSPKFSTPQSISVTGAQSEVLQGDQNVFSTQKYNNWNDLADVTNHHNFAIQSTNAFLSKLKAPDFGCQIRNEFIDAPSINGGTIDFADPWKIDYSDANYGSTLRNQGIGAPPVTQISPFYPDQNTFYQGVAYKGLFLNENPTFIPSKPVYSVRVAQNQTFGGYTGNFSTWNAVNNSAQFSQAAALQTSLVVTSANAIVKAKYKLPLAALTSSASAYNNQRKVVGFGGYSHAVYQSGGSIWYTRNSGTGWATEVPIWIASTAKNPCIATTYNGQTCVHVVWEDIDPYWGGTDTWYCRSTDAGAHWGSPISVGDFYNSGLGGPYDATPVVGSGATGTLAVVGWRYWGGIALLAEPAVNANHDFYTVPNSDATSNHPSMDCFNGYRLVYAHGTDKIRYQEFTPNPTTYQITFPASTDLTSGYSITASTNPTIATYPTYAYVAWDGYNGAAHHIFTRELTSSGWQPLLELTDGIRSESQPTIGVDLSLGKVNLLWQSETHIAKVSSDVTNFGWSTVSDRGVGTGPNAMPYVPGGLQSRAMWITGSAAPYSVNFPNLGGPTMISYTSSVTGTNSQRKLVRGSSGALFLCYESEGDIWFAKSTDNGSTWSSPAYLSRGIVNCANPAMTERNGSLYVVWQQAVGANYNIVYNYSTDGAGATWLTNPITHTANLAAPSPGPLPTIIVGTPSNTFELMVVFRRSTDLQSSRTTSSTPLAASWTTITVNNTNSSSQNPSLAYLANSYGYFNLTWDQGYGGNVSNEVFYGSSWSSLTNVSNAASGGGIYNHVSSSYALNGNNDRLIAWQGYHQSYSEQVIVFNKNLNPTVFTEFYNNYYRNYYQPTIAGHNSSRASLLWYDGNSTLWKTTYDGTNWSSPFNFGSNDKYPATSVMNPPGGTAYSFWTEGTAAPYSIVTSSNGGPLQKGSTAWAYKRRVIVLNSDGSTAASLELTQPVLVTPDGNQRSLSLIPVDDTLTYNASNVWSILQSNAFSLPIGATQGAIVTNRSLTGPVNGKIFSLPLTFAVVDATTNSLLSQSTLQAISTIAKNDQLVIQFQPASGHSVKFLVSPGLDLGSSYSAIIVHEYEEIDSTSSAKVSSPNIIFAPTPTEFALLPNYPNPFNPTTKMQYRLREYGRVRLIVYNLLGQEIRTLVDEFQPAGYRSVVFDGSDLTSGVYYARLTVTDEFGKELYQENRKSLLMK